MPKLFSRFSLKNFKWPRGQSAGSGNFENFEDQVTDKDIEIGSEEEKDPAIDYSKVRYVFYYFVLLSGIGFFSLLLLYTWAEIRQGVINAKARQYMLNHIPLTSEIISSQALSMLPVSTYRDIDKLLIPQSGKYPREESIVAFTKHKQLPDGDEETLFFLRNQETIKLEKESMTIKKRDEPVKQFKWENDNGYKGLGELFRKMDSLSSRFDTYAKLDNKIDSYVSEANEERYVFSKDGTVPSDEKRFSSQLSRMEAMLLLLDTDAAGSLMGNEHIDSKIKIDNVVSDRMVGQLLDGHAHSILTEGEEKRTKSSYSKTLCVAMEPKNSNTIDERIQIEEPFNANHYPKAYPTASERQKMYEASNYTASLGGHPVDGIPILNSPDALQAASRESKNMKDAPIIDDAYLIHPFEEHETSIQTDDASLMVSPGVIDVSPIDYPSFLHQYHVPLQELTSLFIRRPILHKIPPLKPAFDVNEPHIAESTNTPIQHPATRFSASLDVLPGGVAGKYEGISVEPAVFPAVPQVWAIHPVKESDAADPTNTPVQHPATPISASLGVLPGGVAGKYEGISAEPAVFPAVPQVWAIHPVKESDAADPTNTPVRYPALPGRLIHPDTAVKITCAPVNCNFEETDEAIVSENAACTGYLKQFEHLKSANAERKFEVKTILSRSIGEVETETIFNSIGQLKKSLTFYRSQQLSKVATLLLNVDATLRKKLMAAVATSLDFTDIQILLNLIRKVDENEDIKSLSEEERKEFEETMHNQFSDCFDLLFEADRVLSEEYRYGGAIVPKKSFMPKQTLAV